MLNALLFELEHLDLVVDVATLDCRKLQLVLNHAHSSLVIIIVSFLRLLTSAKFLFDRDFIFIAAVTFDILIISQLFSRRRVSLSLLLNAAIVGTCVRAAEGLR